MTRSYSVAKLAEIVGGTLDGSTDATITGVADVREAGPHEASWISSPSFRQHAATSSAGVLLIASDLEISGRCVIRCDTIQRSVALLLGAFAPEPVRVPTGVHKTATVDPSAKLGEGVAIGPHVTVEANAVIGDRTELQAGAVVGHGVTLGADCCVQQNVVLRPGTKVGQRVTILPNAVIGAEGFGFYHHDGEHHRVPHTGGVLIEDDVEIGACSCIDRSKFGNTVIGAGTKIDNLVQLAHNVRIGKNCIIAAQAAIAGSTQIGDGCIFGGRAGVCDNLTVGPGARFAATSVAMHDVPGGETMAGTPSEIAAKEHRTRARLKRLPDLVEKVRQLAARVEKLEASADDQS